MKRIMTVATIVLAVSVVFSGETPEAVNKYFAGWIPQLDFDSTNDCYVACYRPTAKMYASVYIGTSLDAQKIQPGESFFLNRGKKSTITHPAPSWCSLAFTNGVCELDGVPLTAEFKDSARQLLVQGRYEVARDVFEKYSFIVNAEGEAYDVGTKTKFHFGFPFHAPEDKTPPKLNRSMENLQRSYFEEGVNSCRAVLDRPAVRVMEDVVKEDETKAVAVTVRTGGMDAISEDVRKRLLGSDPKYARLFRLAEENKKQYAYVVFCTSENGDMRIAAVAKMFQNNECHFWCYSSNNVPAFVYLINGRGTVENFCEYGDDRCFRNFCVYQEKKIASYWTIIDGVLQKSSDMQKAQEFISKVEEMFNRYVELDTTGTLKPFVERLKSQAEEAKTHQEAK